MHNSSMQNMSRFVSGYLSERRDDAMRIADIGSQEVNGSYRRYFDGARWSYTGVDMAAGKNVDVVLEDVYDWKQLGTEEFDVVVSGQAFEHIEFFWLTMLEVARIMKPGGLCCLIAPSAGFEHRYPVDCWRFYPDGMRALARWAGLEVLDAYAEWDKGRYPHMDPVWQDCVLIARKPSTGWSAVRMPDLPAELHRPVVAPGDASPTLPNTAAQAPAGRRVGVARLGGTASKAGVGRWHLDRPKPDAILEVNSKDRFQVRGWVLSAGDEVVRIALRYDGLTRCYVPDMARADVITKVLGEEPAGHPMLRCGFNLEVPAGSNVDVGFECGGNLEWVRRIEPGVGGNDAP